MLPILGAMAVAGGLMTWPSAEPFATSYLFKVRPAGERKVDWQREVFRPREGDIVLYDDHNAVLTRIYRLVGTDGPLHAAIIYRRADGSMASLEAGAHFIPKVQVLSIDKRFHEYGGTILIRRLKEPLTPAQSAKLTDFCTAQEGKTYAVLRLMLQGTPLRPRGWLNPVLGKTSLHRDHWICSELVVAAATAAEVLNAKDYHANAIFPRDLCYDEAVDLSAYYERAALWYPHERLDIVNGRAVHATPTGRSAEEATPSMPPE